jgi:glycosyltransferase involved in cell wall biosynthesis
MLDISVIIACFNGAATLPETLDSLVTQRWSRPWEIVLVDNGSTDASVQIFQDYARRHPDVRMRVVDAGQQRGKAYALNVGIPAAHGRSLLVCDADDTVAPGWLAAMGAALDRHAFVAARMDIRALNPDWTLAQRQQAQEHGLGRLPHAPNCPQAAGATQGFRREVFDTLGGFDTTYTCLDDIDFCVRAHLAGFTLQFVPEAVVNYRFRDDLAGIYRQGYAYSYDRALLRRRYAPESVLAPGPWLALGRKIARLHLRRLAWALRRRPPSLSDQGRFQRQLGQAMGQLSGALAFRVAPPRPPAPE